MFSLVGLKADKGKRRVKRRVACTLAVGFLSLLVSNLVFIFWFVEVVYQTCDHELKSSH